MKGISLTVLLSVLMTGFPAWAAPDALEQSNPLGHQMLSVENYLHFTPCKEQLSGPFSLAYSGTSEAFVQGILDRLNAIHSRVQWGKEFQFDCSSGVLQLLLSGKANLGISSIPMTSAQREAFVRRFGYPILEARVALDALQILVHPSNPNDSLTVPQLDAIYGSELRAGALEPIRTWEEAGFSGWGAGKPITAFAGWLHYGTSIFFRETVLEGGPWRKDIHTLGVIQRPEPAIADDPTAIVFSNYRPRDSRVKVLAIARQTEEKAYPPLPAHIYGEEYPLTRFFTVYVNAPAVEDLPAETREFLNYLLSYEGQTEVAKTASLPLDRTMLLRARKRLGLPLDPTHP